MVRNIIVFDSEMFKNLSTDVDLWAKCANGSLTKVLGVGDVGILKNDQNTTTEERSYFERPTSTRNEMGVNTKDLWKRAINDDGVVLIEGWILDYLKCRFAGLLNLEVMMGDGVAKYIYESGLVE